MSHYAIGLLLDAIVRQIPNDKLSKEIRGEPLALGKPPIMKWRHLDAPGSQKLTGQKRVKKKMDTHGNTDSG